MIVALSIVFVLFMVISIHELGHFLVGRAAGVPIAEFGIGFPPRLFAIKRGETEYSFNLIIFGAFVRFVGEDITSSSLGNRGIGTRFLVAGAGPVANFLLAILLFTVSFMLPVPVATGGDGVKIITVASGSPAEQAGIQRGDILLSIEGQAVPAPELVRPMVTPRRGTPTTLLLRRGSGEVEVTVVPLANPPPGRGAIGIELGWANPHFTTRPGLSLWDAGLRSLEIIANLPVTLANFFGALGSQPGDNLMGPVGAAQLAGEVARVGLGPLLATAASISLGIAVFNLFPIPPLDGGGMALALMEGLLRGKRLSPAREKLVYAIGMALLISLMVLVTYNDILRLIRGQSIIP